LTDLFSGTVYDYRVEAICNSGPTGYSAIQQFTTTGSGYCLSYGQSATSAWIDLVYIGTLLNSTTSDSGYADYTSLSTDLNAGATYDITLSADINPFGPYMNWKVWIDFNQNDDFSDAGEEVVSYSSQQIGWETQTFTIPANTLNGQTKMRVSMKNGIPAQTPCEIFADGEVEDYTVNINGTTGIVSLNDEVVSVYPNPATDQITISQKENSFSELKIVSSVGKVVYQDKLSSSHQIISLSNFSEGIYFIEMNDVKGNLYREKLMIVR
jgi:hypothetical protein